MMVVYSLFWLPQIIRSAQRGRNCALSKEYLFGTTICRLCFAFCESSFCVLETFLDRSSPADFLAYADNILDIEPRCTTLVFPLPLQFLTFT
jgi:hypothetical protein